MRRKWATSLHGGRGQDGMPGDADQTACYVDYAGSLTNFGKMLKQESGRCKSSKLCGKVDLLVGNLDLPRVNGIDYVVRWLSINRAANALRGPKDLFYTSRKLFGKRFWLHYPRNLVYLIQRDVATVLDILFLLSVAGRLWNWNQQDRHNALGGTNLSEPLSPAKRQREQQRQRLVGFEWSTGQ